MTPEVFSAFSDELQKIAVSDQWIGARIRSAYKTLKPKARPRLYEYPFSHHPRLQKFEGRMEDISEKWYDKGVGWGHPKVQQLHAAEKAIYDPSLRRKMEVGVPTRFREHPDYGPGGRWRRADLDDVYMPARMTAPSRLSKDYLSDAIAIKKHGPVDEGYLKHPIQGTPKAPPKKKPVRLTASNVEDYLNYMGDGAIDVVR